MRGMLSQFTKNAVEGLIVGCKIECARSYDVPVLSFCLQEVVGDQS